MTSSFLPNISVHIVLALLSLLVFGLQFIRYRKSYHLILAIATPCTLLVYVWDNPLFFYSLGAGEGVLFILAMIFANTIDRSKDAVQDETEEQQNQSEEDEL